VNITIDCSPEQMDVIADHLIEDKELGMQPDERHWMLAQARKQYPNCKILKADLNLYDGTWTLEIDPRS
jgi:hypothetical protein